MKTTFYLVRHGQPDWDWAEAMRFYGPCSAYMPLTPLGVEQIEHTACDSQLRGASFILASPYTRTMQSAQILSRRLDLPVTVEWELHEWLYDRDMRGDLPTPGERFGREDMTRCFYRYMEHDELTGEDNCETYAVIAERVLGCLRRYDGQTFLLYIIWYGVTRFFIEGLRTDSLLLPGIDLRVSQVLAAASALVAVVLLIVFRNCHKLTGCGSRKAMEAAGLTVEDKAEKVEIDDTAESTIFSGMSAEEAQEHMTVGTGVKKAAEAENEKTEGNADANASEEPSDEAEEANETAEGESEEKNDGSEN